MEFKIQLTRTWAQALNREARKLLLPLYRNICVNKEWPIIDNIPQPTEFLLDAVSSAFNYGQVYFFQHWQIGIIAKGFVDEIDNGQKEILAFYMHSTKSAIQKINEDISSNFYDHILEGVEEEQELPVVLQYLVNQLTKDDLLQWLQEELGNLDNILTLDTILHWDEYSVDYVNEQFANYIGLAFGEVKLFPEHGHEYYAYQKPLEIFVHTGDFSDYVPAKWYGQNLVPKGYHSDLGDRIDALKALIDDSIYRLLVAIETSIVKYFNSKEYLGQSRLTYTFFNHSKTIATSDYEDGIKFLNEILDDSGEENLVANLNIDLSSQIGEEKRRWGTQVQILYGSETWLNRDEDVEYPVWLLYLENEQIIIDGVLSVTQQTNIVASIVANLTRCYALEYESN